MRGTITGLDHAKVRTQSTTRFPERNLDRLLPRHDLIVHMARDLSGFHLVSRV